MLPVFLIGLVLGVVLCWTYYNCKKETPSDVKFHIQEAEIVRYKNDIDQLEKLNTKLYEEIAELKDELKTNFENGNKK